MSDESLPGAVFLDLLPNQPKNDETRKAFQAILRHRFEAQIVQSAERVWDLPPIILQKPQNEYLQLLLEARELCLDGYFYSCVAMCGIIGERIVKDAFRAILLIRNGGIAKPPPDLALDQLEHVEVGGIVHFLREAAVLCVEAAKAADSLGKLRNRYAHARGKKPKKDALDAIKHLHTIVSDTVSVFRDFEIKSGVLVRKPTSPRMPDDA
ncbi:MAG: hypothetical protein F9K13_09490 [Candidatus Methylomirabilis oxygeniifera]|uniref:DUF4145 domain-containing protein n=1 Tax=Methylomirabilis oxygeniifera TaxID=671143 RepID=D5MIT1_METO1|nr:MAG: hypothetical protein F9K13_09490 [Candidatus Methylomirabilis oxyfera]CBE69438.1 protein of unknown function [Candidatus Methylomirabilis oxyfera]